MRHVTQIPADEQKAIVNMFKDPSSAAATGVKILGNKFFVINSNERSIYGKKQVRFDFRFAL